MKSYFILTGTPGTGKTSVIQKLYADGFNVRGEVTREVLSHQLSIDGPGLPSKDPLLFLQLLLKRGVEEYERSKSINGPVFFDRGIPDLIAYSLRFGVNPMEFERAAQDYLYNPKVFVFPPWKNIFVNDTERRLTYDESVAFHHLLLDTYRKLNFELIEVPIGKVEDRAKLILSKIGL